MSRKTYVFVPLSVVSCGLIAYISKKCIEVSENLKVNYPDLQNGQVENLWIIALSAAIVGAIRYTMLACVTPFYQKNIDKKYEGEERVQRAEKGAENLFKFCFYGVVTFCGYLLIKDLPGTPPMLGGKGELAQIYRDLPHWPKQDWFDFYYLSAAGYNLHSIVHVLLTEKKNDFSEMFLHHMATMALIIFSYFTNTGQVGLLVLMVHNMSDCVGNITRAVIDLKGGLKYFFFFATFVSWFYSRLYVFFYIIKSIYDADITLKGVSHDSILIMQY